MKKPCSSTFRGDVLGDVVAATTNAYQVPQPNSVWSYDFVHDQPVDGRVLKMLCVIDEYTRECLAIEVGASLRAQDVILTPSRFMRLYGKPAFIRSDTSHLS